MNHLFGNTADKEMLNFPSVVGPHDNNVNFEICGQFQNPLNRVISNDMRAGKAGQVFRMVGKFGSGKFIQLSLDLVVRFLLIFPG